MSYCINPNCPQPKNPPTEMYCQACGSPLLLRNRYRALRALGKGGFGSTFLARDEMLPGKPPCVIKQLCPASDSPQIIDMARDLFQREAKILGKIGSHPQLPRLLDYFELDQEFFLVQEFINGSTLQQEVKRGGPFTEAGVKQFLSEILGMVQFVHSSQVIHRDIKPANIIRRDQDKKLVLIDFGAVKDKVNPVQAASSDQTALTAYAIGTPGYAPPEQMAMRPVYASDIYALGVTCIYLLSGKAPKDLNYDPMTGELLWRDKVHVSDHFAKVLGKMLEISVRHRYQSAEAVLRDLDLEPYLMSLAQNMATPNPPRDAKKDLGSGQTGRLGAGSSGANPAGAEPQTPASSAARLAAAIRARRERASNSQTGSPTVGRQGSYTGSRTAAGRSGPPSEARPARLQMTSDEVKQKYSKGRRDFSLQTFRSLDVQRAALPDINFNQSKLISANFQGTDLSNANFGRASLTKANLRNAKLVKAYFHNANLEGADLRGANLAQACLSNANLRGANLCGADLTGALVSDDQLSAARTNWSTVLPNGRRGIL